MRGIKRYTGIVPKFTHKRTASDARLQPWYASLISVLTYCDLYEYVLIKPIC